MERMFYERVFDENNFPFLLSSELIYLYIARREYYWNEEISHFSRFLFAPSCSQTFTFVHTSFKSASAFNERELFLW